MVLIPEHMPVFEIVFGEFPGGANLHFTDMAGSMCTLDKILPISKNISKKEQDLSTTAGQRSSELCQTAIVCKSSILKKQQVPPTKNVKIEGFFAIFEEISR